MTNILNGFAVGDWVRVPIEVEGTPFVGRYAGETGCIDFIKESDVYPFSVKFDDGYAWAFSAKEISLDESYLSPEPEVDIRDVQDTVNRVVAALAEVTGTPAEFLTEEEERFVGSLDLNIDDLTVSRTVMEPHWFVCAPLEEEGHSGPGDRADAVNHPSHYADGWSNGAEVIDITENLNFSRGNAIKYIARAGKKVGNLEKELEDLRKAAWYINREIERLGSDIDA